MTGESDRDDLLVQAVGDRWADLFTTPFRIMSTGRQAPTWYEMREVAGLYSEHLVTGRRIFQITCDYHELERPIVAEIVMLRGGAEERWQLDAVPNLWIVNGRPGYLRPTKALEQEIHAREGIDWNPYADRLGLDNADEWFQEGVWFTWDRMDILRARDAAHQQFRVICPECASGRNADRGNVRANPRDFTRVIEGLANTGRFAETLHGLRRYLTAGRASRR